MIGLGLSIVQLAVRAGLGFARGSSLALDFTSGNRTLDPRITFSRTTNATVTGSNGLIQYAPMNLLTFSEQFDNAAWATNNSTIGANSTAAPDGSSTADSLIENSASSRHMVFRSGVTTTTGVVYTASVYVKSNTRRYLTVLLKNVTGSSPRYSATFDSTLGTVVSTDSSGSPSNTANAITSVGDGWWRVSVSMLAASAGTNLEIGMSDSATPNYSESMPTYTGNGTSSIFIWGAQLEVGSTATTYNPTTVKNLLGFTENFDNAAWTKSNSFVQTNLLLQSQDFTNNAAWGNSGTTDTANTTTAPDGTTTADTVTEDANNSLHLIVQATSSAGAVTLSVFAKAGSGSRFLTLSVSRDISNYSSATFDLGLGVVTQTATPVGAYSGAAASITASTQGFYRCVLTVTTDTMNLVRIGLNNTGTPSSANRGLGETYTGDGTSGLFLWGAQLVQGTTPGDYKATYAAAAAVGYTDIYGQPFAQKFVPAVGATTATAAQAVAVGVAPYTFSFRAKAAEQSVVSLVSNLTGVFRANIFNLAAQTVSPGVGWTASITPDPSGNGWFICSCTATADVAASKSFQISNNSAGWTGDGTSGIYIFGAQLSDSASVDPYVYQPVAAPASTAYYGPRFDYDPVTLAPKGLLIEEQRTQLLLNSSLAGTSLATQVVTVTAAAHTLSFYGTGTVAISGTFVGSLVGTGAYPTRSTLTFTPLVGAITLTVTGTVQFAQLEIGAFATSFIPSAASQVTRAADSASMIGNNFARWYNVNTGTVFVQADTVSASANAAAFALGSTTSDIMRIFRQSDAQPVAQVITGGATQATLGMGTSNWVISATPKIAFSYATDNFSATANGGTTITDTLGSVPVVSQAVLGNAAGIGALNGHLIRLAYYNRRLANTELTAITS